MDKTASRKAQATSRRDQIHRRSAKVSEREDPKESDERLGGNRCKRNDTEAPRPEGQVVGYAAKEEYTLVFHERQATSKAGIHRAPILMIPTPSYLVKSDLCFDGRSLLALLFWYVPSVPF